MAEITFHGDKLNTVGELPELGSKAPDFVLTDKDLNEVRLSQYSGYKKVLNIVPSLDTPVCAESTRKFNQQISSSQDVIIFVISADLPFAQSRFCEHESIKNVLPLSLIKSNKFAIDYGVLIKDGILQGLCARAVIVLNQYDTVVHKHLVKEVSEEPDYHSALVALKNMS